MPDGHEETDLAAEPRAISRAPPVSLTEGLATAFGGMADAFERLSEHAAYLAEEARRIAGRDEPP